MINFDSPQYVSIVLHVIYVLLFLAVALTMLSALRSLFIQARSEGIEGRVPQRRIALAAALLLVVSLAVTWLLGSTSPLIVNGKTYNDAFWLRISDMLIYTSIVLMAVVAVVAVVGIIRRYLER